MSFAGVAFEPTQSICMSCGLPAPTREVCFYQNIGMLVARRSAKASGKMCRRCIRAHFQSFTLTTFFLGWWGVISFIVTPFFLLNNVWYYLTSLKMAEPLPSSSSAIETEPKPISVGVGDKKLKIIYGVVVCVVLLGIVAYNNVDFVERHAPSLNARLHSGEITEGADAEYAGMKIFADLAALNADPKSKDWPELRAEYLTREPYLVDLKAQNDRLQRAVSKERAAGRQEFCEQLAIDKLAPAVNDYATTLDKWFAIMKSTVNPTGETVDSLKKLAAQEDATNERISAYLSESKANGCSK